MEQKMTFRRTGQFCLFALVTIALSVAFACLNKLFLDGMIAYLAIDIIFLSVLVYVLENNRLRGQIGNNSSIDYKRIWLCYLCMCILVYGFYYLPAFTCPAVGIGLFLSMVSNPEIAMVLGTFLCTILSLATGGTFHEFAAYGLLVIIGAQMAKTMSDKQHRIWGCMILFAASLGIPVLFYYLAFSESAFWIIQWNALVSLVTIVFYFLFANRLYAAVEYSVDSAYADILQSEYSLVRDIKKYSKAEYVHAMKVSTVSEKCATVIGADSILAAAAGFYYRLGVLEGEPVIENSIRLAEENCFPKPVIQILAEYNGEQKLPSSKESAIVHMVDACLKKIEMLSGNNLSTAWNQDMVIYQTLNEISGTGIYDESGLSMNQFLKIRELLVREEIGYDNYD